MQARDDHLWASQEVGPRITMGCNVASHFTELVSGITSCLKLGQALSQNVLYIIGDELWPMTTLSACLNFHYGIGEVQ